MRSNVSQDFRHKIDISVFRIHYNLNPRVDRVCPSSSSDRRTWYHRTHHNYYSGCAYTYLNQGSLSKSQYFLLGNTKKPNKLFTYQLDQVLNFKFIQIWTTCYSEQDEEKKSLVIVPKALGFLGS